MEFGLYNVIWFSFIALFVGMVLGAFGGAWIGNLIPKIRTRYTRKGRLIRRVAKIEARRERRAIAKEDKELCERLEKKITQLQSELAFDDPVGFFKTKGID